LVGCKARAKRLVSVDVAGADDNWLAILVELELDDVLVQVYVAELLSEGVHTGIGTKGFVENEARGVGGHWLGGFDLRDRQRPALGNVESKTRIWRQIFAPVAARAASRAVVARVSMAGRR
jgi:hypothetical protein